MFHLEYRLNTIPRRSSIIAFSSKYPSNIVVLKSDDEVSPTSKTVMSVDLTSLQDHRNDALYLQQYLVSWLDNNYEKKIIHGDIARAVFDVYLKARNSGESDLIQLMLNISSRFASCFILVLYCTES